MAGSNRVYNWILDGGPPKFDRRNSSSSIEKLMEGERARPGEVVQAWKSSDNRLCVAAIPCSGEQAARLVSAARKILRKTDAVYVQEGIVQIVGLTTEDGADILRIKTDALKRYAGARHLHFSSFDEPDDLFGDGGNLMDVALGLEPVSSVDKVYCASRPLSPRQIRSRLETAHNINPLIGYSLDAVFAPTSTDKDYLMLKAQDGLRPWKMTQKRYVRGASAFQSYGASSDGADLVVFLEREGLRYDHDRDSKHTLLHKVA